MKEELFLCNIWPEAPILFIGSHHNQPHYKKKLFFRKPWSAISKEELLQDVGYLSRVMQ